MNLKKKLLALGLAMTMTLGMSSMASAVTVAPTYSDMETVTIDKNYELAGEGISPAETFTITQIGDGTVVSGDATSAPALGTITPVTYAAGAAGSDNKTGTFTVTLPTYTKTGIYEYTLKETAGSTAGVTYREDTLKLVVTVIEQDGLVRVAGVHTEKETKDEAGNITSVKSNTFSENTYTANKLTVSKEVTGNLGDKTKEFNFTVTFTAPEGKTWTSAIAVADGHGASDIKWSDDKKEVTFTLSDDDSVTFENIPEGVEYAVVEDPYSDYKTTYDDKANGTMGKDAVTTVVTNDKQSDVDTGINLDSLPYMIILAVVLVAGLVAVLARRRRFE